MNKEVVGKVECSLSGSSLLRNSPYEEHGSQGIADMSRLLEDQCLVQMIFSLGEEEEEEDRCSTLLIPLCYCSGLFSGRLMMEDRGCATLLLCVY